MLLNIEKERPEVVLDVDRIEARVRAAMEQYPGKFAQEIAILARIDGSLLLHTVDGGSLRVPPGAGPLTWARMPTAASKTTALGAAGPALPATPGAAKAIGAAPNGSALPRPGMGAAARAYGSSGSSAGGGTAYAQLQQLSRAAAAAESAALRKHLTAHQKDLHQDYLRLMQALRLGDARILQELKTKFASVLAGDPEVEKAQEAVRAFKAANKLPG